MPMVLRYDRTSGRIDAGWVSVDRAFLEQYCHPDDPTWAFLLLDKDGDIAQTVERSYVHKGLVLAKQALTLTADPAPFAADGETVCRVSVAPFVPCTLLVDGQAAALTEADPVLELTADAPHTFYVALDPMVTAWADPVTVEAT